VIRDRIHIEALLAERDKRMDERHDAQKTALAAALVAADRDKDELQDQIDVLKVFQSKLISIALGAPVATAVIVFLLTRSGG